jgi:hypothetical protein
VRFTLIEVSCLPVCNVSLMHEFETLRRIYQTSSAVDVRMMLSNLTNLHKEGDEFSICLERRIVVGAQEGHHHYFPTILG